MKIRDGFISNSSTSSFIIDINNMSLERIKMLLNPLKLYKETAKLIYNSSIIIQENYSSYEEYLKYFKNYFIIDDRYEYDIKLWEIKRKKNKIYFRTYLNNFLYDEYAELLGFNIIYE